MNRAVTGHQAGLVEKSLTQSRQVGQALLASGTLLPSLSPTLLIWKVGKTA